jgi:peroxiredoxin
VADLTGHLLPDLGLPSTQGGAVNLRHEKGRVLLFTYPYTGKPGWPDPPGWDLLPGAHGSTPQNQGFAKLYAEFATLHVKLFGLSFQTSHWQAEFAIRAGLPFALLSDDAHRFANALKLECFRAGETSFLCRYSLLLNNGRIVHANRYSGTPAGHAAFMLQRLAL